MGQGCRASGRGQRGFDVALQPFRASLGRAAAYHLEAAGDAGEHVIEIVCYAARQLADRVHFLALAQRRLGSLAVRCLFAQSLDQMRQCSRAFGHAKLQGLIHLAQDRLGALSFTDLMSQMLIQLGEFSHPDLQNIRHFIERIGDDPDFVVRQYFGPRAQFSRQKTNWPLE